MTTTLVIGNKVRAKDDSFKGVITKIADFDPEAMLVIQTLTDKIQVVPESWVVLDTNTGGNPNV